MLKVLLDGRKEAVTSISISKDDIGKGGGPLVVSGGMGIEPFDVANWLINVAIG